MAKSAVAKAVEDLAEKLVGANVTELPAVDGNDNGKVLKVSGGKWGKGDETVELPAVTGSDNGKVLMVVEGQWALADIPSQLPAVTAENAGQVLTVNESGAWAAAALPEG